MITKAHWALFGALTLTTAGSAHAKPRVFSVAAGSGTTAAGLFTAGPQGAVLNGPGGSRLELSPGTELRIFNKPQDLQLQPGRMTRTHTMLLNSGRIEVEVPEQGAGKSAILVSFQRKLMAIASEGRLVAVASPHMSAVANAGGQVLASWGAGFKPLHAGRVRRMTRANEFEGDVPTAPSWEPGRRVWIAVDGSESIDALSWRPVPEAARYQIQLRREGEQLPFATQASSGPRMEGSFDGLTPGIYHAHVRAFDVHGIGGRASEPARVHVLGVKLPKGSFTAQDGGLFLAHGQKAEFTHADGLLMSYLGATRYYPANTSVGLYRNERTIVHFRAPETDQFASIRMAPRNVTADVFIGPKTAIWPRDEVVIRVRLRAADDTPMAEGVEMVPEVSVGIDPIELKWRREGADLVAKVPAPHGKGPWVVRVDIKDQFGFPLGRDFLEIVDKPRPRRADERQAHYAAAK